MTFVPQRLLCLVDLSPRSAAVLSWARLMAESYRAEVEVFHASWAPKMEAPEEETVERPMMGVLGTEIEGRVNTLSDAAFGTNVKYKSRVVEGHPVKMVLYYLMQHPPDLIVLGSHGYDGFARVLLGSVAENVLRSACCPMLIVKGAPLAATVHALRTLVCAVDLSEISRPCVQAANDLAGVLNAGLHVVHVANPGASLEQVRTELSSWIEDAGLSCKGVSEVVLEGDPGEKIVTYARDVEADLTILAAEHRPFLEFTTVGRTTERVVRFCHSSVLVVPKVNHKPPHPVLEPGNA